MEGGVAEFVWKTVTTAGRGGGGGGGGGVCKINAGFGLKMGTVVSGQDLKNFPN